MSEAFPEGGACGGPMGPCFFLDSVDYAAGTLWHHQAARLPATIRPSQELCPQL